MDRIVRKEEESNTNDPQVTDATVAIIRQANDFDEIKQKEGFGYYL